MERKDTDLGNGVIERRFYDQDGKLTEIRKIYPPATQVSRVNRIPRNPGGFGGHDY